MAEDEDLAKLLIHQTPDCLNKKAPSEDQRYDLINSQIFGYRFVPEIAEDAKSWISLSMSNFVPEESFRHFSDVYMMGNIYFYILVDTSIMETETGYRQDLILARIYELFNYRKDLGIGVLRMEQMIENWEHNNKFGGYTIGFQTVEFR